MAAALLALSLCAATGGDPSQRGAYCPLPPPGQKSECLVEAEKEYSEFFSALEQGSLDDASVSRLEADLRGRRGARYYALSSLAYGYVALAQRASESASLDAATARRLEAWNQLLTESFAASDADPAFRDALRTAAIDIQDHAPPVLLSCVDAEGQPAKCDSTEAVIRGFGAARDNLGIRGQLARLFERWFGEAEAE